MRAAARPPGPKPHVLLGNLPEFGRDLLGFLTDCAGRYGDVVYLQLGRRPAYLVSRPDLIERVLVADHRQFVKHSWFWRHVTAIFGQGLLTSEGNAWVRQRRLIQPAFHRERIAAYGEVMGTATERMLDAWPDGVTLDLHRALMGLTLRIVAKTLFDAEVERDVEEVGRAFDAAVDEIAARFRRPIYLPDWIPLPGNRRYTSAVGRLDRLVYRLIDEHRARPSANGDLLSLLLAARDEDGTAMTDRQVRDEAVTMILAGHETTALALSWTWYLLAQHPSVADRLGAEARETLGARPAAPTDLPRLPYAEATVTEVMRLYPPAYVLGRESLGDYELDGWKIPAGATVFASPWVMQRGPRFFEDPETFRPERWLDGLEARLPPFAYFPFGGGPRRCIGHRFALMEAVILLATMARRIRVQYVGAGPVVPFPSITLRPAGGVPVRIAQV